MLCWHSSTRRGSALIWALVALVALGVTIAGATTTFLELVRLQRRNHDRLIAVEVGQHELERLHSGSVASGGRAVEGLPGGHADVVVTPDSDRALRRVRVEVRWRDNDGERRMQWTTLVNR